MPISSIVVALGKIPDAELAALTVSRAMRAAEVPAGLRFSLSRRLEKEFWDVWPRMGLQAQVHFYGEREGFAGALEDSASHTLLLTGEYDFGPKWDQELLRRFAKTARREALLTGMIGAADGAYPPQAYLPGLSERFEAEGAKIVRGLPLVESAAPPPTMVVYPGLIFARTETLRRMDLRPETLSFAAYASAILVYVLDRPVFWPLREEPPALLRRPLREVLPGTTLVRFEQLAGFREGPPEDRRSDLRTRWGLFTREETYAQQLPAALLWKKQKQRFLPKSRRIHQPLLVTAFIDLPQRRKPIMNYLLRFRFLMALEALPLYLYTGGTQERTLRSLYPNARSCPDTSLLPRSYLPKGMTQEQWLQRSKPLLLLKTAEQHPDFDSVAWVNMDTLKHPLCPQAEPDFTPMMDGRIHLATVNAIPDLSFVMVPAELLKPLCRLTVNLTQVDDELKRGFSEVTLWQRLIHQCPNWFCLHPMPKKHLLFLTGFDPALLDERYRALLGEAKPGEAPMVAARSSGA